MGASKHGDGEGNGEVDTADPERIRQGTAIVIGVLCGVIGWWVWDEFVTGVAIFVLVAWAIPSIYEQGWPWIYTDSKRMIAWTIGAGVVITLVFSLFYGVGQEFHIDHRVSALGAFVVTWFLGLLMAPFAAHLTPR